MIEENSEEAKGLILQPDLHAFPAQLPGAQIDLERAEPDDVSWGGGFRRGHAVGLGRAESTTLVEISDAVSPAPPISSIDIPGRARKYRAAIDRRPSTREIPHAKRLVRLSATA